MEEIVNSSRSEINSWENSLGFISRYSYWNSYEDNHSDFDDYDNQSNRLADPYFESVINRYNKIMIDDTLYRYNFTNRFVRMYFPNGDSNDVSLGDGTFFIPQLSTECGNYIKWALPSKAYYNGSGYDSLKVYKWISNFKIYNSIGIGSIYYRINGNGKEKRQSTNQLTHFIDQWHEVTWYYYPNLNSYGELPNNTKRITYNKDHNQWVFEFLAGWDIYSYCVTKFERFHCYKADFNDDLHRDQECH